MRDVFFPLAVCFCWAGFLLIVFFFPQTLSSHSSEVWAIPVQAQSLVHSALPSSVLLAGSRQWYSIDVLKVGSGSMLVYFPGMPFKVQATVQMWFFLISFLNHWFKKHFKWFWQFYMFCQPRDWRALASYTDRHENLT